MVVFNECSESVVSLADFVISWVNLVPKNEYIHVCIAINWVM